MKKPYAILLILIVLSTTLSSQSIFVVRGESADKNYLLKSTVKYSNPASSSRVWDFTQRKDDRTISLFMDNNWQTVELLNSTFSFETEYDEDGNAVAALQFPSTELSAGSNLSFTVWYQITAKPRTIPNISESLSDKLSDIPQSLVPAYTREEGPWQISNPTLQQLAHDLSGSETNVLTIVKNFITWIDEHVEYPQTRHENPYYPIETYTKGEGDCDDKAMLLITLSRIVGIPAYLQIGCIYTPSTTPLEESFWDNHVTIVEKSIGWHGWAIVYIPPWGWLPVDLTYIVGSGGIAADPLNAIKHGAVTVQNTIQYMNVTHADYVASSFESRTFLTSNGFLVFSEDEMIEGTASASSNSSTVAFEPWIPLASAAVVVSVVAVSFLVFRHLRKRRGEAVPTPPENLQ